MTCITVKTQQELDTALAAPDPTCIHIESERGLWLNLTANNGHTIEAWGSSSVVARGSSSVVARDSSSVVAWGSSSVEAWGSSSVEARGSSSVEAWGSSSVEAWGSSSVVARGSSSVEARGSSSVEARGSSSVVAWGATRVSARDRSKTTAGAHVAVHLHSGQAIVEGGVIIDITALNLDDAATWYEHYGVKVVDGRAVLYKAVNKDLAAGRHYIPTEYPIGADVVATDWRDNNACGGGLHLSPHPRQAGSYEDGPARTRRYLRCTVAVEDLRPLSDDKCKVRACRVEAEVDIRGRDRPTPVLAESAAA